MRTRISKYKHLHSNRFRYLSSSIPLICASGLLVTFGMMIAPWGSLGQQAYAVPIGTTGGDGGGTGDSTTTASVSMVFDKDTVTNEQVDVTAGTPIASQAKHFTITPSGSVEKYSIYVQTTSNANGALVGSNTNNSATIATLADKTTGVALNSMGANTWGYALDTGKQTADSMLYKGISGSTSAISAYDSAANPTTAQDFTLAFAANIGNDKPADHYVANVLVSVAANPGEVTTLYSVSYSTNGSTSGVAPATQTAESYSENYTFTTPLQGDMVKGDFKFLGWSEDPRALSPQYEPNSQITLSMASPNKILYAVWARGLLDVNNMNELTPTLCKISATNDTKQLKDTRDNKMYWVTKLADGNCWMTQNLDYDDPDSTKLNTPSEWGNDAALSKTYYDPGDYFYSNTSSWSRCNTATGLSDSSCKNAGWATSGDGHFHVGNYYSWSTVLGGDKENNNAVSGICAEGWKLPRIGNISGSFGSNLGESVVSGPSLTSAYYVTSSAAGAAIMRNAPMYFVPSGYLHSGKLDAGANGFYWTSTEYSTNQNGYFLALSSEKVDPVSSWLSSYIGHSVRCLVLGS